MLGNLAAVTVAPATTSAPTAENSAAVSLPDGKIRSTTGQDLPQKTSETLSPAEIERALKALSEALPTAPRSLNFRVDKASGMTVITVLDADTHQVVRQIPAEEMLALSRAASSRYALVDEQS